ncbi:MAG: hypothetical protein J2P25_06380 [Nocardiopsaceae bacterium]|nr:hypothetical protein [Nocardiopsaceae bacterium]
MKLDNGRVRVEIDEEHGRIVGIGHAGLGIEVVTEPRLAENFRLLLPLPSRRGHYLAGRDQRLAGVTADGDSCRLTWNGLRCTDESCTDGDCAGGGRANGDRAGGGFGIEVTQEIRLDGDDVTFRLEVVNRSPLAIEEASTVVLGGMGNDAERDGWRMHLPNHGGRGEEWRCYDTFPGSYLGPAKPTWCRMYPGQMSMPWLDVYHAPAGKGFYLGNHDPEVRLSAAWAELTPFTTRGGPRGDAQYWPEPRHLDGEPAGMALAWNSFPFLPPGGTWQGPTVTLHFHDGTWWAAAEYFRSWYDARIAPERRETSWMSDEDAWQSTIISYPDGTVGYRFRDLPALARRAREAGINVLQIDGWDVGGIDRDYPDYSPDPRLGTADELRQALAECRDLGVRVMLFTNLQWVHGDTDWYAEELHKYVVRDPYGLVRNGMGWEYNTTLGQLGQTVNWMYMANPSRPEFQRLICDQLHNVVRLGAPGTQIDKLLAMNQVDYAPDNPAPRDSAVPAGTLEALRLVHSRARQADPDFGIASEAHWDRAMPYLEASYSRFFDMDHLPTFAAAFPEYRQSCCITGDFDYGLVNNCLRYGHIINVEARCLHGDAGDVPHLARYVAEALRVRRSLRDRIWDSRLVDPAHARVHGAPSIRYCLHRGRGTGTGSGAHTLVLNHFEREARTVTVEPMEDPGGPAGAGVGAGARASAATLYRPFAPPQEVSLPAEIDVPPDEFVIVAFS